MFIKSPKKVIHFTWIGKKQLRNINIMVVQLIMPPAGLPNKGLRKKALCKIGFLPGRTS
jgi:hypothetical protein